MNDEEEASMFKGSKALFDCPYESSFELRLMTRFEVASKVKSFYRPNLIAKAKTFEKEIFIVIDFLIEYENKKTDLVHIEKPPVIVGNSAEIFILSTHLELQVDFGFVIVSEQTGDFRRFKSEKIKIGSNLKWEEIYFGNFKYVN